MARGLTEFEQGAWARKVAGGVVERFADAAAIETAHYATCSLIVAMASLVLSDPALAMRVGGLMEAPRGGDADG